jgi:hypothetical protein
MIAYISHYETSISRQLRTYSLKENRKPNAAAILGLLY